MIIMRQVSYMINACWYHEFACSLIQIKPYEFILTKIYGRDKAPDYVIDYLFDRDFGHQTQELLFDYLMSQFKCRHQLKMLQAVKQKSSE